MREKHPGYRGWQEGNHRIHSQILLTARTEEVHDNLPDPVAVEPADGKNRARLNADNKRFSVRRAEPHDIGRHNQVASGRDRQKFRQAFHDAHQHDLYVVNQIHVVPEEAGGGRAVLSIGYCLA